MCRDIEDLQSIINKIKDLMVQLMIFIGAGLWLLEPTGIDFTILLGRLESEDLMSNTIV
jgi:hypothetical protein